MQNYHIDGEIAYSISILIYQRNHWRNKTIDARELFEIWSKITFDNPETFLRIFTTFLRVQSITKNGHVDTVWDTKNVHPNNIKVNICNYSWSKSLELIKMQPLLSPLRRISSYPVELKSYQKSPTGHRL